jgi:hypothetical protein
MFGVDSQAGIFQMQTKDSGPAQLSAIAFGKAVAKLQLRGYEVEILWTPSDMTIEKNKRANNATEQTAQRASNIRAGLR